MGLLQDTLKAVVLETAQQTQFIFVCGSSFRQLELSGISVPLSVFIVSHPGGARGGKTDL